MDVQESAIHDISAAWSRLKHHSRWAYSNYSSRWRSYSGSYSAQLHRASAAVGVWKEGTSAWRPGDVQHVFQLV